ncbi:hypothetical protein TNCV_3846231 [Trichonephila clavipes]|nr:hypothetical protein TNCV_3846231 [Trichonephila clavipes]
MNGDEFWGEPPNGGGSNEMSIGKRGSSEPYQIGWPRQPCTGGTLTYLPQRSVGTGGFRLRGTLYLGGGKHKDYKTGF